MVGDVVRDWDRGIWRDVHHYVYVDRPFDEVCQLLAASPERIVGHPADESHAARSDLHLRRGGLDLSREVQITTRGIVIDENLARLSMRWEDARRPKLFPVLEAVFELYRLFAGQHEMTRVGVVGRYRSPLGAMGTIGDALAGRRLVLESVEHFLDGLAQRLERQIPLAPESAEESPATVPTPASKGGRALVPQPLGRLRHVYLPVDGLASRAGGSRLLVDVLRAVSGVADVQIDKEGEMAIVDYDATRCGLSQLLGVVAAASEKPVVPCTGAAR